MTFQVGNKYKYDEIHEVLGGDRQFYLSQTNGKIVCGYFTSKLNPQAPYIILVGNKPKNIEKAEILSKQEGFIPVFLKQKPDEWEYQGNFQLRTYSIDKKEIECIKKNVSNRDDITGILYLGRVDKV